MKKIYQEEKRKHCSQLVPYSYYKCSIPEYFASVPVHWHGEFEINYILSGRGEFICADERIISQEGDIIIIPPNMLHAIYPCKGQEMVYDTLVFSAQMLGLSDNDRCSAECIRPICAGARGITHRISDRHPYYGEIKTSAENIFSCAKVGTAQLDLLLKSELMKLFWLLENSGDIFPIEGGQNVRSEIIRPALEYISEHFRENITVEKLAETAHLSKSYFMSRFRQSAGVSAVEYINQLRIQNACEQLRNTGRTVAEISFDCGFRNLSNFNRQFLNIVGCTPVEYRKINTVRKECAECGK